MIAQPDGITLNKLLWYLVGLCGTVLFGVSTAATHQLVTQGQRIGAIEAKQPYLERRLESIDAKLDRLLGGGSRPK